MLEALSAVRKTARNSGWEPIPEAAGWCVRWKKRGGHGAKGDTYWQTPQGDEVRSMPEARRWLERGELPDKTKSGHKHQHAPPPMNSLALVPSGPRTSMLLKPIQEGHAAQVEAMLQRQGWQLLLHPGLLQKAVLKPAILELLLRHLPDAPAPEALPGAPPADGVHCPAATRMLILDGLDERGFSALALASYDHSPEGYAPDATLRAAKLLLDAGASVDLPVREGRSRALNEACACREKRQPRTAIVHLLLDAGVQIDLGTAIGGWTALQTAAEYGNTHVVIALIERGASIDQGDDEGRTALIWATVRTQPATVSALLHCGADPSARTACGWTALQIAEGATGPGGSAPRSRRAAKTAALLRGECPLLSLPGEEEAEAAAAAAEVAAAADAQAEERKAKRQRVSKQVHCGCCGGHFGANAAATCVRCGTFCHTACAQVCGSASRPPAASPTEAEEADRTPTGGEELVGRLISVDWPDDQTSYDAHVLRFLPLSPPSPPKRASSAGAPSGSEAPAPPPGTQPSVPSSRRAFPTHALARPRCRAEPPTCRVRAALHLRCAAWWQGATRGLLRARQRQGAARPRRGRRAVASRGRAAQLPVRRVPRARGGARGPARAAVPGRWRVGRRARRW